MNGVKVVKFRKRLGTELHMGSDSGYGFLVGADGREFVYTPSGRGGFGSNRIS